MKMEKWEAFKNKTKCMEIKIMMAQWPKLKQFE